MASTLGEQLALAYLRGDKVAIYALADLVQEERSNDPSAREEAARIVRETRHGPASGYAVFMWPEFRAFFQRMGGVINLLHYDITIHIPVDGLAYIDYRTQASDTGPQPSFDTTTQHNENWRTSMTNPNPAAHPLGQPPVPENVDYDTD